VAVDAAAVTGFGHQRQAAEITGKLSSCALDGGTLSTFALAGSALRFCRVQISKRHPG